MTENLKEHKEKAIKRNSKFAKKICDGGGHEYAAGGILNDNVLALSKQFEPLNG